METHVPKVVGLIPGTVYWIDIFTYICCKNCDDVCLKRPKTNYKRGRGGPILKNYNEIVYYFCSHCDMKMNLIRYLNHN